MESALWADPIQLPSPGTTTATLIQFASLEGFSAQATLTAGNGQVRRTTAIRCPWHCRPLWPAGWT